MVTVGFVGLLSTASITLWPKTQVDRGKLQGTPQNAWTDKHFLNMAPVAQEMAHQLKMGLCEIKRFLHGNVSSEWTAYRIGEETAT